MLLNCELSKPLDLWQKHRDSMSEDFLFHYRNRHPNAQYNDAIYNRSLIEIEDKINSLGGMSLENYGIPTPDREQENFLNRHRQLHQERNYDPNILQAYIRENKEKLNEKQKVAYHQIVHSVQNQSGNLYFLDAPGGTGKTFLLNLIPAFVRKTNHIALAVASSGIAATLLQGGKTAHSTFKLPLKLQQIEMPTCNIKKRSALAELLKQTSLIIWDECTMSHKRAFKALDRTLQDIRNNASVMGGITVVMSGDFRQILPVIPRGLRADTVQASVNNSYLWRGVQKLHLSENIRARLSKDDASKAFAKNLLKLGESRLTKNKNIIVDLNDLRANLLANTAELLTSVFPKIQNNYKTSTWLSERAILAPRNDEVRRINASLLAQIPENSTINQSIDSVLDENFSVIFSLEFIHSLNPSGFSTHTLELKCGVSVMLLRNLDPPKLCNGTRLIIKEMLPNLIRAEILGGKFNGECAFIPRIPLISSDAIDGLAFKRLQFPIQLSFAMTINKSQGQTFSEVGVDLTTSCFSHGQLYVACSRVGTPRKLHICTTNKRTKNIVYKEALEIRDEQESLTFILERNPLNL